MISKKFDVFANQNGSPANRRKNHAKVTRSKSFFLVLHNPRTFEDTAVCLYNENKKGW